MKVWLCRGKVDMIRSIEACWVALCVQYVGLPLQVESWV